MQIQWKSLDVLKNKRVDLWILLPSGVIINRLLDCKGLLKQTETLESFFGIDIEKTKEAFYKKETNQTLFGEEEINRKTDNAINKIAKLYVERLKTIFEFVTNDPLKLLNSKNVPIYHFIFASNNQMALKIANQIIETKKK